MTGSTQALGYRYAPRTPTGHKAVQPERSTVLQSGVRRVGARHPEIACRPLSASQRSWNSTVEHEMTRMGRSLTMTMFVTLVAFSIGAPAASAENCRALPAGPERHACAEREHPEQFAAKLQHCKDLASARGDTMGAGGKRPGGMRDFVQACMQGRQH
jgi:hypothetical protein